MTSEIHNAAEASLPDKRSRNKTVVAALGVLSGIVWNQTAKFLTGYDGPWGIKLALVLVPVVLVGVLAVISRRCYQADELEKLINRQALAFAFYAALSGLFVLHLLQMAGFVPHFLWTTKGLILGLVLLMSGGILWTKRRYV